jgi:hypothetical protein
MNWTHSVTGFVRENDITIILVLAAVLLFVIFHIFCISLRLRRLSRSRKPARVSAEGDSSEQVSELSRQLDRLAEDIALLDERSKTLDGNLARSMQRVGLVRFDAFPDIGGEQSFALALLDREANGVIMSSLYGRSESRVYAKEVMSGQSQHALSDEERKALQQAGVKQK